jgi:hypothetical protein
MAVSPLLQRKWEAIPFINETPGVFNPFMKGDSTDPSLKQSRKPHSKVDFMPHFATIEAVEDQLNHGRFELKKKGAIKPLLHLFEGG